MTEKNDKIDIRLAQNSDINTILSILDKAAIWLYEIGITNQWVPGEIFEYDHYYKEAIEKNHLYVAVKEGIVIGTFLIRWSDKVLWGVEDDHAGYIHHLAIDRAYSNKGLGQKLLDWAENKIRSNGKSTIRLDCVDTNTKLNQYYLDKGYKYVRSIEYYDGDIGNLYEKNI